MTDTITIYHNPRCSKSRAALEYLQHQSAEVDADVTVVEYLNAPITRETLLEILDELGLKPGEVMRKGEAKYKELNLKDASLTDNQQIDAIIKNPILLERPIVRYQQQAAIGRPLENIIDLFD